MAIEDLIAGSSPPNLVDTYFRGRQQRDNLLTSKANRNRLAQAMTIAGNEENRSQTMFDQAQNQFNQEQMTAADKQEAMKFYPILDQALQIENPAQRRQYLMQTLPRLDAEDEMAIQDILHSNDAVFDSNLKALHQQVGMLIGANNSADTVQSSFRTPGGTLGYLSRTGKVVDTGQAVEDAYTLADVGGGKAPFSRRSGSVGGFVSPPEAETAAAAGKAEAVSQAQIKGKSEGEQAIARPGQQMKLSAATAKTKTVSDLIDQAKSQAGLFTTGFFGGLTQDWWGTPAHDLKNNLDTIKANIGFDKLQELRDSSPTGGALGQVSERENVLLQSVWGALEQSQSRPQFVANLERVKKQVKESWARVSNAYKQTYGEDMPEDIGSPAAPDMGGWSITPVP